MRGRAGRERDSNKTYFTETGLSGRVSWCLGNVWPSPVSCSFCVFFWRFPFGEHRGSSDVHSRFSIYPEETRAETHTIAAAKCRRKRLQDSVKKV